VKTNPDTAEAKGRTYVGCDTGFNHLVRVAMYDAWHRIDNLSRPQAAPREVDVVGNICESGDVFARARSLPMPQLGDLLALRDAGAYGMAMASTYNTRPLPAEVVVDGEEVRIARRRETVEDLLGRYAWETSGSTEVRKYGGP
jgi:diaminopimelate decarboxylase